MRNRLFLISSEVQIKTLIKDILWLNGSGKGALRAGQYVAKKIIAEKGKQMRKEEGNPCTFSAPNLRVSHLDGSEGHYSHPKKKTKLKSLS